MLHVVLLAAEEKNPILPDIAELIYGTLAFLIVFFSSAASSTTCSMPGLLT